MLFLCVPYRKEEKERIETRFGTGQTIGDKTKSIRGIVSVTKGGKSVVVKVGHGG